MSSKGSITIKDARRARRIPADIPVAVSFIDGRRIRWATNLSCGGLQLRRGIEDVMAGDEVDVSFRLPDGAGKIACRAEVVYAADGFVGLWFLDLRNADRDVLARCTEH